jgi:hypothetical protein
MVGTERRREKQHRGLELGISARSRRARPQPGPKRDHPGERGEEQRHVEERHVEERRNRRAVGPVRPPRPDARRGRPDAYSLTVMWRAVKI